MIVYDNLKAAILRRYSINEDTYRQRFRTAKLKAGETPRELAIRLHDLADRWTKASTDSTDATDILDIFVKEQLINTMPEDVRLWVRKHKPKTSEEAGQLAEDFILAGQPLTQTTTRAPRGERPPPPGKCPRCGKGATGREIAQRLEREGHPSPGSMRPSRSANLPRAVASTASSEGTSRLTAQTMLRYTAREKTASPLGISRKGSTGAVWSRVSALTASFSTPARPRAWSVRILYPPTVGRMVRPPLPVHMGIGLSIPLQQSLSESAPST